MKRILNELIPVGRLSPENYKKVKEELALSSKSRLILEIQDNGFESIKLFSQEEEQMLNELKGLDEQSLSALLIEVENKLDDYHDHVYLNNNIIMKSYIGTKIVNGEPMTRKYFNAHHKSLVDLLPDEDGYFVRYEDGYKSWSPKEVFERCYREITQAEQALIK